MEDPGTAPRVRVQGLLERDRGLSKLVISRVIIRVTPFRALITLLITYLLSPLPLQVGVSAPHGLGFRCLGVRGFRGLGFRCLGV